MNKNKRWKSVINPSLPLQEQNVVITMMRHSDKEHVSLIIEGYGIESKSQLSRKKFDFVMKKPPEDSWWASTKEVLDNPIRLGEVTKQEFDSHLFNNNNDKLVYSSYEIGVNELNDVLLSIEEDIKNPPKYRIGGKIRSNLTRVGEHFKAWRKFDFSSATHEQIDQQLFNIHTCFTWVVGKLELAGIEDDELNKSCLQDLIIQQPSKHLTQKSKEINQKKIAISEILFRYKEGVLLDAIANKGKLLPELAFEKDQNGFNILHHAILKGRLRDVMLILRQFPSLLNEKATLSNEDLKKSDGTNNNNAVRVIPHPLYGATPLLIAARRNFIDLVEFLLSYEIPGKEKVDKGQTLRGKTYDILLKEVWYNYEQDIRHLLGLPIKFELQVENLQRRNRSRSADSVAVIISNARNQEPLLDRAASAIQLLIQAFLVHLPLNPYNRHTMIRKAKNTLKSCLLFFLKIAAFLGGTYGVFSFLRNHNANELPQMNNLTSAASFNSYSSVLPLLLTTGIILYNQLDVNPDEENNAEVTNDSESGIEEIFDLEENLIDIDDCAYKNNL